MEFLANLSEEFWHFRGYSAVEYKHLLKLRPQDGVPRCYVNEGESHYGPDSFAMDIIIPDPNINSLPIYSPASGIVGKVVNKFDQVTTRKHESWMVNTIRVHTTSNEYFEIKHFRSGGCKLVEGQEVHVGQKIAETGPSGFYSDLSLHHVHFAVHGINKRTIKITTFPLKIRFKEYNIVYGKDGSVIFKNK